MFKSKGSSPHAEILTRDGVMTSVTKDPALVLSSIYGRVIKSVLARLTGDAVEELYVLADVLRSITIHSFIPERIRAVSFVVESPTLGYYGERLARVVLHLYLEERRVFAAIEDVVKSLIPEVEEIIPHLEGDIFLYLG